MTLSYGIQDPTLREAEDPNLAQDENGELIDIYGDPVEPYNENQEHEVAS